MSARSPITIQIKRCFDVPADRVFDAWLDAKTAGKWLFATPTGKMVRVEIDARVGGKFVIVEQRDGHNGEHYGTYLEIARPSRLVFSFSVEKNGANATRVSIDITPRGTGCELTLSHEIDPDFAEYVSRTEKGWRSILEGLAVAI